MLACARFTDSERRVGHRSAFSKNLFIYILDTSPTSHHVFDLREEGRSGPAYFTNSLIVLTHQFTLSSMSLINVLTINPVRDNVKLQYCNIAKFNALLYTERSEQNERTGPND